MLIGIDLGTTNSLAACYKDGKVELIPNRLGKKLTPSIVSLDENDHILVGEVAFEYGATHPNSTVKTFKRTMGTDKKYTIHNREFSSEELSSFVLRSLKEDAQTYLGCEVDEAIISVPAYFNDKQRKATKLAGELAGLKVSRIINEPTASAIAYGVGDKNRMERCLVFDLGGGTLDITVIEYFKSIMEVHAIAGDNHLGGEDFTALMAEMFLDELALPSALLDERSLTAVYKAAEKAKCEFSQEDEVTVSCYIREQYFSATFTLQQYQEKCKELIECLRKPVEKAIHDAKVSMDEIDRIILVGGATRLPLVRDFVSEVFNVEPDYYVDPDSAVAIGAALQCGMKLRDKQINEMILTDVCPFTLGTEVVRDNGMFEETGHYLPIIERNTVIPVSKRQTVYTAHDNQKYVNVKVLQGESRMARNNLQLGSLEVEVPVGPKGQEAIEITYTYDVNSLLEVEVKVLSTGEVKKAIIQNDENKMDEAAIEQRLQKLAYLKQNPRDEEENYLAILRADRLYEQSLGQDREMIEQASAQFNIALNGGSRLEIERARRKMMEVLDEIDRQDHHGFVS